MKSIGKEDYLRLKKIAKISLTEMFRLWSKGSENPNRVIFSDEEFNIKKRFNFVWDKGISILSWGLYTGLTEISPTKNHNVNILTSEEYLEVVDDFGEIPICIITKELKKAKDQSKITLEIVIYFMTEEQMEYLNKYF